ncbi:MAG: tetratricopeptide repeat protein [Kiloniellaceae bacterium]
MQRLPTNAISILSALWVALAVVVSGLQVARADQTDNRLDNLFTRLLEAPAPGAAQLVEGQIWSIWVQSDDGAVRILMREGIDALSQGNYSRALSKFEQIVLIAPGFAEGWNKRATVHYLLGNYAESLADISKTLELEPRHFGALSGRGLVYVELEDERRALKAFEAALAIHPNLTSAALNAAQLRKMLRDREI